MQAKAVDIWRLAYRMCGLQDPVCICRVSNHIVVPFHDQVTRRAFEQRGTRKAVDVELRFGWHDRNGVV